MKIQDMILLTKDIQESTKAIKERAILINNRIKKSKSIINIMKGKGKKENESN